MALLSYILIYYFQNCVYLNIYMLVYKHTRVFETTKLVPSNMFTLSRIYLLAGLTETTVGL